MVLLAFSLGLWLVGTRTFLSRFLRRQRRRKGRAEARGEQAPEAVQAGRAHPERTEEETAGRQRVRTRRDASSGRDAARRSAAVAGDGQVGEAGVEGGREQSVAGRDTPLPGRESSAVCGMAVDAARRCEAGARHEGDSLQAPRVASDQQGPHAEYTNARDVEKRAGGQASMRHEVQLDEVQAGAARFVREQVLPPRRKEDDEAPDLHAWVLQLKREHEARLAEREHEAGLAEREHEAMLAEREHTLLPCHRAELEYLLSSMSSEKTCTSDEKAWTFHHLDENLEADAPDWNEWMQLLKAAYVTKVHGPALDNGQQCNQVMTDRRG